MAVRANIYIDQGSTFNSQVTLNGSEGNPIDLTPYTVEAQMRKTYTSSRYSSFTTSANSSGIITLFMPANTTSTLEAGRYVYDVKLVENSGVSTRIMEGQVTVTPSVSR